MIEIPIMFCFDKNYVIPASVAFLSLLEHANKKYKYIFYIIHNDISLEQQKKLRKTLAGFEDNYELYFMNFENKFDDIWQKVKSKVHFTKEVLYKLLVSSIFPQHDKIIVSDVDVVFLEDISESYFSIDTSIDDCYMAGVKQVGYLRNFNSVYEGKFSEEEIKHLNNFCGGYIIFNLHQMRKDNLEKTLISYLNKNAERIIYAEQDVLNICVKDRVKYLPLNYVSCTYMWDFYKTEEDFVNDPVYTKAEIISAMEKPIQLHYASTEKPWKHVDTIKSSEWFKYIVKTAFLEDYLMELPYKIITKQHAISEKKLTGNKSVDIEIEKLMDNKIRIVWLVNDLFVNNFKSVYDECKKLSFIDLRVMAVPHLGAEDLSPTSSKKISDFLSERGIEHIDSFNPKTNEYINLKNLKPDYVFYFTPYNYYLPEVYSSNKVKKYAKVCHVSYGSCLIEYKNDYEIMNKNEFYNDCYNFFCETEETIQEKHADKYRVIGCLKLDDYLYYSKKDILNNVNCQTFTIVWKPRWTLEDYDSHFFEYIETFIEKIDKYPNIKFKLCIHPLLEYKVKRKNYLAEYNNYIKILNSYNNYERVEGSDFLDHVLSANVLIADISSTMAEFSITGKPLIYTSAGVKLNDMGEKIVKNSYVVYNKLELGDTIDKLIKGVDLLKTQRVEDKNKVFFTPPNGISVAQYLIKYLIKDYIEKSNIGLKNKKVILKKKNKLFVVNEKSFHQKIIIFIKKLAKKIIQRGK